MNTNRNGRRARLTNHTPSTTESARAGTNPCPGASQQPKNAAALSASLELIAQRVVIAAFEAAFLALALAGFHQVFQTT